MNRGAFSSLVLVGLALVDLDCAGAAGAAGWWEGEGEVHGSVSVADPEPRLLIAGPALLLHVDVEQGAGVTVFRVPRRDGTARDCRSGPRLDVDARDMSKGALAVTESESLCAMVSRRASLSWHARESTQAERARETLHQASLP